MNTWFKIAFGVAGRVVVDLLLGTLWGLWLGVICGALCGAIFAVIVTKQLEAAALGAGMGAIIGFYVGTASGLVCFLLHSLMRLPTDAHFVTRWRSVANLMFKMNFVSALAGGLSLAILGWLYEAWHKQTLITFDVIAYGPCAPSAAGFFYGSVSGFFGSLLLAALFPEQLERAQANWRRRRGEQPKVAA